MYKQSNGVGDFVALNQTSRNWRSMTSNGVDVYACVVNSDIYKQSNGVGDFVALNQTSRDWRSMTSNGVDVYACVYNGDIYTLETVAGSTLSISDDAVLPSIPIGSRRRIYNSGVSTIKIYALYPDTIDGMSNVRIVPNDYIEIEKFATNVVKTTGKHAGEYFIANSEAVVNTNGTSVKTIVGEGGAPILANTAVTYYDCALQRDLLPNETTALEVHSKANGTWIPVDSAYIPSLFCKINTDTYATNISVNGIFAANTETGKVRIYFSIRPYGGTGHVSTGAVVGVLWSQIVSAADGYDAWRIAIR